MSKYYHVTTYGCQMNVHESEKLAGIMESYGYVSTQELEKADIVCFNTCCIRESAETHAYGNIGALKKLKKQKPSLIIAVGGCMTEQVGAKEKLLKTFPFVDIVFGANDPEELSRQLSNKLKTNLIAENPYVRTGYPNAWINIVYGCNNFCTYCIVPYVKGRERSRDLNEIISEVDLCLSQGYKEITFLGQNVNSYCYEGKPYFPELLRIIAQKHSGEKFRIRFMSNHPKDVNEELLKVMSEYPDLICPYVHLPLQSGSSDILRKMNRKYTKEQYLDKVKMIRSIIPDCAISTDIIVGFPTETEQDFQETLSVVEQAKFSGAFTFVYSKRSGTVADKMEGQIDKQTKKDRITRLVAYQNDLTREQTKSYKGKTIEILVEDYDKKRNLYMGRDVYNRMGYFACEQDKIGEFIKIKINKVNGISLFGELVDGE